MTAGPDFDAMSTPEDFERYFASTTDYSDFARWMQRGRAEPPAEVSVDVPDNAPDELLSKIDRGAA